MRSSDWSTLSRPRARRVLRCSASSSAPALGLDPLRGSSASASGLPALFGDFTATVARSGFSPPCIMACGFRLPNAAHAREGAGGEEASRFPCRERRRAHGVSDHAEPVGGQAMASATVLPSRFTHPVGARKSAFAAQYPAHDSPYQRFTADLAISGAWHGAGAAGYAFTVQNLHLPLLAGFSGARGSAFQNSAINWAIYWSSQAARMNLPRSEFFDLSFCMTLSAIWRSTARLCGALSRRVLS